MNKTIQVVEKPIADLIAAEYNPRKLSPEQKQTIMDSIKRFGLVDPILVNVHPDRKNIIIGGHQRTTVAKELGYETVPCVELELTLDQEKELNVRLNKNTGEFDFEMLQSHFEEADLLEWGFTADEMDWGFEEEEPEVSEDDFDEEPPEEPKTELGRIYQLGEHRLMCGDSTKPEDVQRLMGGESVDMLYTDPPYGIKIVSNGQIGGGGAFGTGKEEKSKGKEIKANQYADIIGDDSIDTAKGAIRVIESLDIKTQIIWGGNYYANELENSNCWVVWDKETGESTFADAELAWTNQPSKVRIFKHRWSGICKASEHGEKRVHPTQKPLALAEWCFNNYGNPSSVLDPSGGSGSTLMACENHSIKSYTMEFSPAYCDVIVNRYCKLKEIDPEKVFETGVAELSEKNKIALKKRALLEALEKSLGVVTTACKAAGVSRARFYEYKQTDPDFAKAVDEIDEIALDFAETSLHKQINEKNTSATIFYLKTRGRKRGYIERREVDVFGANEARQRDLKILERYGMLEADEKSLLDTTED